MLNRLRARRDDEGFTLIELLVVIIIIGILAAIAIPVFLNQRQKGWEAAVQSDLRNAATAQETYLTENATYSAETPVVDGATGELGAVGFKYSDDKNYQGGAASIAVVSTDAGNSYCMQAQAAGDPGQWYSYSSPTGLTKGQCS